MPRPRRTQICIGQSFYVHCTSRVVDRNFVFDTLERDVFRKVLRQVEGFTGVRVITWTILSNHFHVLLEVPPAPATPLSDEEILSRCRALYEPRSMDAIEWEFENARRIGGVVLQRLRERFLSRMWNLSEFMKTLKQKFSTWFNRTHQRVGTLWESRFKSVYVGGGWEALFTVAAYIDLNSVRAGIVADPKDYRWSGYAEAVAGDRAARKGLAAALVDIKPDANWRDVGPRYRKMLFGIGGETSTRAGISDKKIAEVWAAGGKLTLAQLLRCHVRYFTDGLAIGTESFIEAFFHTHRNAFGKGRKTGARRLKGGDWGELRTARALSVNPISPGGDG